MSRPASGPGRVRRALDRVNRVMAALSVGCIAVMLVLTILDITRRTVSGRSVEGVNELGEVAMVFIVFLGLAYAEQRRAHVAVTLLVRRLPHRVAAGMEAAGIALVMAVVVWMVVVTGERALESLAVGEYRFGLVRIPIWPARIVIVVGLAAYLLQLGLRLVDDLRVMRGAEAPDVLTDTAAGL